MGGPAGVTLSRGSMFIWFKEQQAGQCGPGESERKLKRGETGGRFIGLTGLSFTLNVMEAEEWNEPN